MTVRSPLQPGSISLRLYPHDLSAPEQIAELVAQARLGEQAGFDGIMVSEHHADFPGYLPNPSQLCSFILPALNSAWAAPCPLLLPIKAYALVVEELAWLEAAYPGRVGAGFAAGALPVDFELAEVPFDEVISRFKAALGPTVAALRGDHPEPLGRDRAVSRLVDNPLPMAVAVQSSAAAERAARYGLGVLYDSLQDPQRCAELSSVYRDAGGEAATIAIRRIWIGPPPEDEIAAQIQHYRSYAPAAAMERWADEDQTIVAGDADEAAERVGEMLMGSGCDTLNLRVHVKGLSPDSVRSQIELLGEAFSGLRAAMTT
jgi:alkanesulfonate monooxygenase SsuD/methylene tetrahydromethanopterin reductase-like flavin-dependent oxidoreductase (luciferase family)